MKPTDEHVLSVYIDKDHPACDGHFEGNPLLPGVITLEYVRCAFKEFYPGHKLKSFSKVKLTHSLKPGETLAVHLSQEHLGKVNFRCLDSMDHQIAIGSLVAE